MSSPEARAIEVIDHVGDEPSNVIAAALAKEGLLAPDLPPVTIDELDRPSVMVGPASPGDARDSRVGRIILEEDGLIFTTGVPNPYRSIDQARAHALAILAMCNHAEGELDAVD